MDKEVYNCTGKILFGETTVPRSLVGMFSKSKFIHFEYPEFSKIILNHSKGPIFIIGNRRNLFFIFRFSNFQKDIFKIDNTKKLIYFLFVRLLVSLTLELLSIYIYLYLLNTSKNA